MIGFEFFVMDVLDLRFVEDKLSVGRLSVVIVYCIRKRSLCLYHVEVS